MPVVVKEALAMEVPVVGSDEVGMPEMVRDEWGRLVPPRDAEALAGAIAGLLALPPQERATMGRRGREFVVRNFSVRDEALKLIGVVERE
jgi:glycosyltransferase involved in cell wall biosynthesis